MNPLPYFIIHLLMVNGATAADYAEAAYVAPPPPPPVVVEYVPPPPAYVAPAPVAYTNRIVADNGSVNTSFSTYSDCTGLTPIPTNSAVLDTCAGVGRPYYIGHAYSVFGAFMTMPVGAGVSVWDGAGVRHHYRIVSAVVQARVLGIPQASPDVVRFQTSMDWGSTNIRILTAVAA